MKVLMFIVILLTCNIYSAQVPHGIFVSPKDYQPFLNYHTQNLVETLSDTSTLFLKKKKAFGEYVFDLQDSVVQFWAQGQLFSESKIFYIAGHPDTIWHICAIPQDTLGLEVEEVVVKYFIFIQPVWEDIQFIVWWYDPYENIIQGEISKKIHTQYLMRNK
tara:strand:- start:740 stop:1222 length:483 start_codon:yes stop_codon:yes gene_type:complete